MTLSTMATTLTSAVALQSVAFEGNPLTMGDTDVVRDRLFGKMDMSGPLSGPLKALGSVPLPPVVVSRRQTLQHLSRTSLVVLRW
ncbi:hypothetical protein C8R46DRAFT_1080477 [Mycena filopes]|nr:hypothetical protein C8R46DRAFT_1080477 [Mycena filopes]